ncbi:MAG TPA: nitrilase-related carbon-nitrogen hydrolase, partial [Tepidisphaeraceae bacterium]|nr:nitrilase-related carbon-nitrogen hydrolase [Tepidisphaeraceae bacterium]
MRNCILALLIVLGMSACALGGEIIFEPNIEYANPDNQHLQLNLARPKEAAGAMPAVVCIHGGGFRAGNRTRWDALCKELAGRGYVAVTIQYRLSPKYQFPAAVHDAKSAVRWLRLNASKYHVDPQRIGAIGDSAGGHLVQFLAVTDGVKEFEGEENPGVSSRVTCVVNYYGPSDFTKSFGKSVDAAEVLPLFLGGDLEHERQKHVLASPLNWATPHAAPTLLIHGTEDKYVAYEQATWMHDRLKAAAVEVQLLTLEGAGHGFKGADAEKAAAAANEFLDKHLLKAEAKAETPARPAKGVRIAAAQPKSRLIDWHLKDVDEVLKLVDQSLSELEGLIDRAAAEHCDVIALPEDTLGLGTWEAGNEALAKELLPRAVKMMLERFSAAAAKHQIYAVCCNDSVEADGRTYNTAFLIGRDGKEIGRYHKVCPTIHERVCTPGDRLPVFQTKDLGGVGMLICYDMVFPETARCLALSGADVIFHPTLGGAAIGDDDISRAAFRTRAVENFVYIVVAQRGSGSMIISPQGKILAEAQGRDSLAIADIDPFGGREGGDAMNSQRDMRARLFRERNPGAFGMITESNPPALAKIPATILEREAVEIAHRVLTVGQEEFKAADSLAREGKVEEAVAAFKRLQNEYKDSWIDRVSTPRLAILEPKLQARAGGAAGGVAAKYPGDRGIDKDPRVVFAEDFEAPTIGALKARWEDVKEPDIFSFTPDVPEGSGGKQSLLMTH